MLPGLDAETTGAAKDSMRALQTAMGRAAGTPKWLRNMKQLLAVWDRYCVVAECCEMQTKTQLIHYKPPSASSWKTPGRWATTLSESSCMMTCFGIS